MNQFQTHTFFGNSFTLNPTADTRQNSLLVIGVIIIDINNTGYSPLGLVSVESANNSWVEVASQYNSSGIYTAIWVSTNSNIEAANGQGVIITVGTPLPQQMSMTFGEALSNYVLDQAGGNFGASTPYSVNVGTPDVGTNEIIYSIIGVQNLTASSLSPKYNDGSSYFSVAGGNASYGYAHAYIQKNPDTAIDQCNWTASSFNHPWAGCIASFRIPPSADNSFLILPVTTEGGGDSATKVPDNVSIRNIKVYIDGVFQGSPLDYNITKGLDQVTSTCNLTFARPLIGPNKTPTKGTSIGSNIVSNDLGGMNYTGASYGVNSKVKVMIDEFIVFNGLWDTDSEVSSDSYRISLTAYDWLSQVMNQQLDLEGWVVGGSADASGNLVEAGGASFETVLVKLLAAAGVPSASIALQQYTAQFGASSGYLMGSVVPYYATQTGFWDIISEVTIYNGWTVYCLADGSSNTGKIVWEYLSPKPGTKNQSKKVFTYGLPGKSGWSSLTYTSTGQYCYNRVEVTGVDATGVFDDHGHQCSQVAAISSSESALDVNGVHLIPNNSLNTRTDPVSGKKYLGYRPLQIQSNSVDVPDMAFNIAKRALFEVNALYEEIQIDVQPDPTLDIGDQIWIQNEPRTVKANGGWIIKQIVLSNDGNSHKSSITACRGSFGNSKYASI